MDGTPRKGAPPIPQKSKKTFEMVLQRGLRKLAKFGVKKIPVIGMLLTVYSVYEGYKEVGF